MGFSIHNFLAGCLLVASVASTELRAHQLPKHQEAFASFIQQHGREYKQGTAEYDRRLALFSQRLDKAEEQNAKEGKLWTAGTGPLSDYTQDELQQRLGWFGAASPTRGHGSSAARPRTGMFLAQVSDHEVAGRKALPEQVLNWTTLSSLAVAKDQGGCGSCWAVASATVLDAHAEIYKAPQASFSAQELVNCVKNPRNCGGSGGCGGATVELAMNYFVGSGLETPSQEPYTGTDGKCRTKAASLAQLQPGVVADTDVDSIGLHSSLASVGFKSFGMRGWERLPENQAEPLLRAVYERGPVAISVAATGWDMYISGIFNDCPKDAVINHAVTLVGYGKDSSSGHKFWLVQNSWGSTFGENGRIRLLRQDQAKDESEYCGIDHQPKDGTACDGGPAQVKVCGMCGILYDNVVPHFMP
eukprot:CAMPEP_0115123974 /NCGR_PEP_ID=MMETSP0227-20121206/47960_1 /TAXON_ID=89957 /ORGANISM="Polarella glacialis, Strain CCMP 1383" /LENGTH=415 /DNA_ID=CAMNT_0002526645 /DNA_START=16 /DNA_END=1263 /DNA_ORIENTATION=+